MTEIAQCAFDQKVRLLVDAEQTYYQPAIDNFTLTLLREFNKFEISEAPTIFNTYQCYLKDAKQRLEVLF